MNSENCGKRVLAFAERRTPLFSRGVFAVGWKSLLATVLVLIDLSESVSS